MESELMGGGSQQFSVAVSLFQVLILTVLILYPKSNSIINRCINILPLKIQGKVSAKPIKGAWQVLNRSPC